VSFGRRSVGSVMFDAVNYLLFLLLSVVFLYPLLIMIALSLSDPVVMGGATPGIIPVGFTVSSYRVLLESAVILRYYANTLMYVVLGTFFMISLTSLLAYALMHRRFSGRRPLTLLLLVTMFFSGGLVPLYLLVRALGLYNTIWPIVLPNAVGAWNVIIFRTFFLQLPEALRESAQIDGAGHLTVLLRVVLPLSKALLATFTLFTAVAYWNSWFEAVIFLRDRALYPIQVFLRSMLIDTTEYEIWMRLPDDVKRNMAPRQLRAAALMLTITPILCVYPFLQRYFAKGVLVGSLKG
jgi:putative aldouronate transport system permease protein